jgi:nicotinamidase-related amidase
MSNVVLLVVDVQTALIKEHPYNERRVIDHIKELISTARNHDIEVIYVRHDDGKGSELEYDSEEWQIYTEIAPKDKEKIVDKRFNSAFVKTGLNEYMNSKDIGTIILTGLQTEYCIDATCKSAFEHGFRIIIPEETNTTFDNEYLSGEKLYEFYNYKIWNNRFAKVMPVEEVMKLLAES